MSVIGAVSAGFGGFFFVLITTHAFPSEVAGSLFALTALFLLVVAVAELGCDIGLVHFVARLKACHRVPEIRTILRIGLWPPMLASIGACLIALCFSSQIGQLLGDDTSSARAMVAVFGLFVPFAVANDLFLAATRGMGTMRPTVLVDRTFRSLTQPLLALLVIALGGGAVALALGWATPFLGAALLAVYLTIRLVRSETASDGAGAPALTLHRREYWIFTAPRAAARILQVALLRADVVLLAILASPADAAIYTVATRFVVLGQLPPQAVQQTLQPQISSALALSDRGTAQRLFQVSTAWLVLLTWPIYLMLAVYPSVYLGIFSPQYADAGGTVAVILALTLLLANALGSVDTVLVMAGKSGVSLVITAVALAVNLILNIALIPTMGLLGAAVAWSIAIVVRNLATLVQLTRHEKLVPWSRGLGYAITASALSFGLMSIVCRAVLGQSLIAVAVTVVMGGGLFLVFLKRAPTSLQLGAFRRQTALPRLKAS